VSPCVSLGYKTIYIYIYSGPTVPLLCWMPYSRTRRHTLAKISEESMTVDHERQPLLHQVKSRDEVYDDVVLPEEWSLAYRWGLVALLAFTAFTV
jgi:hypothetical protein